MADPFNDALDQVEAEAVKSAEYWDFNGWSAETLLAVRRFIKTIRDRENEAALSHLDGRDNRNLKAYGDEPIS